MPKRASVIDQDCTHTFQHSFGEKWIYVYQQGEFEVKRVFTTFAAILCATTVNAASPNLVINDFNSEALSN